MSASTSHPEKYASNDQVFNTYLSKFSSASTADEYIYQAKRFTTWLSVGKAYYSKARPRILEIVLQAHETARRLVATEQGHVASYIEMAQTVLKFANKFEGDEELQLGLLQRVRESIGPLQEAQSNHQPSAAPYIAQPIPSSSSTSASASQPIPSSSAQPRPTPSSSVPLPKKRKRKHLDLDSLIEVDVQAKAKRARESDTTKSSLEGEGEQPTPRAPTPRIKQEDLDPPPLKGKSRWKGKEKEKEKEVVVLDLTLDSDSEDAVQPTNPSPNPKSRPTKSPPKNVNPISPHGSSSSDLEGDIFDFMGSLGNSDEGMKREDEEAIEMDEVGNLLDAMDVDDEVQPEMQEKEPTPKPVTAPLHLEKEPAPTPANESTILPLKELTPIPAKELTPTLVTEPAPIPAREPTPMLAKGTTLEPFSKEPTPKPTELIDPAPQSVVQATPVVVEETASKPPTPTPAVVEAALLAPVVDETASKPPTPRPSVVEELYEKEPSPKPLPSPVTVTPSKPTPKPAELLPIISTKDPVPAPRPAARKRLKLQFGPDLNVLQAIRGLQSTGDILFTVKVGEKHLEAMRAWRERGRELGSLTSAAVVSLACFRYSEVQMEVQGAAVIPFGTSHYRHYNSLASSWPGKGLELVVGAQKAGLVVGPDGLIDLTPLLVQGVNEVRLRTSAPGANMARYVFTLLAHHPTREMEEEQGWREWKRTVGGTPLQLQTGKMSSSEM